MLRGTLIDGSNNIYDRDYSKLLEAVSDPGVVSGLNIVDGKLKPGGAFISVIRASTDSFYCYVENTEEITVDVTGTKKIWLEVKQSSIDDGLANNADGSNIVEIKTGASYPTKNFLKLASVVAGVVTDERYILDNIQDLKQALQDQLDAHEGRLDELDIKTDDQQEQIDSILVSAEGLSTFYFGDGRDGDVTISGTVTLSQDMYYNNLIIPSGQILNPNGYRIFIKGSLTGAGKIQRNGNAGGAGGAGVDSSGSASSAGGTSGVALNAGSLSADVAGVAGGACGSNGATPTAGTAGLSINPSYANINGVAGGAGGNGYTSGGVLRTNGAIAGIGGTSVRGSLYNKVYNIETFLTKMAFTTSISSSLFSGLYDIFYKTMASGGGGGGGGSSNQTGLSANTNSGGGGGGSGSNGGIIWIACKTINWTGTFEAIGGNGGAGGNGLSSSYGKSGGGGGGAGGNGGILWVCRKSNISIGTVTLSGGIGGNGGTATAPATAGANGSNGNQGIMIEIIV